MNTCLIGTRLGLAVVADSLGGGAAADVVELGDVVDVVAGLCDVAVDEHPATTTAAAAATRTHLRPPMAQDSHDVPARR